MKPRTHTIAVSRGCDTIPDMFCCVGCLVFLYEREKSIFHFLENISMEYMDFFDGVLEEMSRNTVSGG